MAKHAAVDYHIYLDKALDDRLTAYIQKHYGDNSRVRSAIIQRAVTEFLDHAGFTVKGK